MSTYEVIDRLMDEYGDTVLRLCYLYLKDYHLAEDATQETFIKVMNSYSSFKNQSSEKTWITRIAINCCKNILRTRWIRSVYTGYDSNQNTEKVNPIDKFIQKDSISRAIMELKEEERAIVIMYYYQELSVKEVAEIVGKTESAVMQKLNRARKKMKINLED
ncbi:MAG: sigma-70 family RNA polymerase sigma factor [Lachnospiraceae bacterium]|nr:sigma-70 family RNA polymerase sigma factor [Lachnospiraceae bacterium]